LDSLFRRLIFAFDGRQKNWQRKPMSHSVKLLWLTTFIMAATMLSPSPARADRLFSGDDWGTDLYEFDTTAGAWSKVLFCDSLRSINGMNTDAKGNLYVSNIGSHKLLKFTLDGDYTTFCDLGGSGGAAAFDSDGNLFVPYFWDKKIMKFSPDGSTSSLVSTNVKGPEQVVFDSHGTLFAADQASGHIYTFDPDGTQNTFASGLKWVSGITFDSHGILFVADDHANTIYKFAPDGKRTIFSTGIKKVSGLTFDSHGNLFASDGVGKLYKFTNKSGGLSPKPVLFASDLGHNYWIIALPGSMPMSTLLPMALARWWMWLALSVLLAAGVFGGFWLHRKSRRAAAASNTKSR
jgi:sugar lactone lactonase YvrE